ncbi:hypothetical protein R6Q59_034614 [Mikania micrantha]
MKTKLKEIAPLGQLEATQKELNLAMTKYTKLSEKQFNPDISKSYRNVFHGSDIELKLHRLQFLEILKLGNRDEDLLYMRTYISPFSNQHFSKIQKLMTCLLWAGKLESSPYMELLSSAHWVKLAYDLVQQFCNLLGESYRSPLSVTVAAGVEGLPTLLKLANVMTGKKHE